MRTDTPPQPTVDELKQEVRGAAASASEPALVADATGAASVSAHSGDGQAHLTERELLDHLHEWHREGARARDTGAVCPYQGNTLAHYCHASGWLTRDLQLALIEASPKYAADQALFAKARGEGL